MHFVAPISTNRNDWISLFLAVFLLGYALRSLKTGSTILIVRDVKRSDDGLLYWIAVLGALTVSVAVIFFVISGWYH